MRRGLVVMVLAVNHRQVRSGCLLEQKRTVEDCTEKCHEGLEALVKRAGMLELMLGEHSCSRSKDRLLIGLHLGKRRHVVCQLLAEGEAAELLFAEPQAVH